MDRGVESLAAGWFSFERKSTTEWIDSTAVVHSAWILGPDVFGPSFYMGRFHGCGGILEPYNLSTKMPTAVECTLMSSAKASFRPPRQQDPDFSRTKTRMLQTNCLHKMFPASNNRKWAHSTGRVCFAPLGPKESSCSPLPLR